jgi:hypothetical protein
VRRRCLSLCRSSRSSTRASWQSTSELHAAEAQEVHTELHGAVRLELHMELCIMLTWICQQGGPLHKLRQLCLSGQGNGVQAAACVLEE